MKLNDRERAILAAYELGAKVPVQDISKSTGLKGHSIRYALRSLLERRVIYPVPLISAQSLGLTVFTIYFSISAKRKIERENVVRALLNQKEVVKLSALAGEFQYGMTMIAPHVGVVASILEKISANFHRVFNNKAFTTQLGTTIFNRKYLAARKQKLSSLTTKYDGTLVQADAVDNTILTGMCTYPTLSHRQLATELQIPHSSLELRVKKLEKQGVIRGYLLIPDITKIGVQSFKVLVYAKGIESPLSNRLQKFCMAHPDITYLTECLGNWDYEIGFEAENAIRVNEAVQDLYDLFGESINGIRILTKFKDLKYRWYFSR